MAGALLFRALFSLFDSKPPPPPPRPVARPQAPPSPVTPEISTEDLRRRQLVELVTPLSNPWGFKDATSRNPWDKPATSCSGRSSSAVPVENPWGSAASGAPAAPGASASSDGQCSRLWESFSQELNQSWKRTTEAWKECNQFLGGTPKWNECVERVVRPTQAASQQIADQQSASLRECRDWVASNRYEEIAERVDSVKSLYDKAVKTPAVVAKIQDTARSMINDQHTAVLGQLDEAACGMDEISGNPWR